MIKINFITPKSEKITGVIRYINEISKRLEKKVVFNKIEYNVGNFKQDTNKILSALRAINKLFKFAKEVKARVEKNTITHIVAHDLAYLLNFIPLEKTIVTCYDLMHLVYYRKRFSPFWQLNIKGLKKADRIITISNFSKNEIVKCLKYSKDKIDVIHPGVDYNRYYQKRSKEILKRYNISENKKIILYVGSEHPRQNVPFLIKGFAELKKVLPGTKLLKIGNPQWPGAREKLEKLIRKLNLKNDVVFLGYIPEEELPKFYNAADLFVYPCLYAGFGIPLLEAMACGVPVITSNLTSLPEVVGTAGKTIDPLNQKELTEAMYNVLTNEILREEMIIKGLERAKIFTWEKSAQQTLEVYNKMK